MATVKLSAYDAFAVCSFFAAESIRGVFHWSCFVDAEHQVPTVVSQENVLFSP